ncbi:F-box protein [Trifolium medium]|uniref:F-box protein n=1 Tax=Trifolium medium TaxID=97028 RepID=A0A392M944_9FABA|nr:F-box protein [Trifolium medium]
MSDFLSIISLLPGGYRSFFLDAFPSIHPPLNNPLPPPLPPAMARILYAVDIYLNGEEGEQQPLYSLHTLQFIETYEYTPHPLTGPRIFKFVLVHSKGMMNFIKVKKEGCEEYLKQKLTFSCMAIDPRGRKRAAGSLFTSGCKAVSAEPVTLGVMVVFESVLPVPAGLSNFYTEMIKCRVVVTCCWKGDKEDKCFVNFVYFTMKDMNGKPLVDRHGAAIILNAIQNGERRGRTT